MATAAGARAPQPPVGPAADAVLVATGNAHKLVEMRRILLDEAARTAQPLPALIGLGDLPPYPEPVEDGETFAANAVLKARAGAAATGRWCVADDSGLCVDALHGMPGVLSARWAGRHGDDQANLDLVRAQVGDVPDGRRGAAFVCAVALAGPDGSLAVRLGSVRGTLLREPRGHAGFGYDPLFVPAGETATTAELPAAAKDALSHRGRALRQLLPLLAALGG